MILLAVDPGIRGVGAALFNGDELSAAGYVKSPAASGNGPRACVVAARAVLEWCRLSLYVGLDTPAIGAAVFEWPQVYASRIRAGTTREDPNDLIALAGVDGAIAALLPPGAEVSHTLPAAWKGQLPKEACIARVWGRLSEAEKGRVRDDGAKAHNTIDAIGIGLHHLQRFDRRRVIHR